MHVWEYKCKWLQFQALLNDSYDWRLENGFAVQNNYDWLISTYIRCLIKIISIKILYIYKYN